MEKVEGYEKQLKESKGKEKKNLQQTIETLRKELVEIKENTSKREQAIENMEKAKHQSEEKVAYMLQTHTNEMERARREYEAKEDEKVREEVRKQIEEAPSFFGKIYNSVTGFFSSIFS